MKTHWWVILCALLLIGSVIAFPVTAQTQTEDFIITDADAIAHYDTSAYTGSTSVEERYIYEYLDWEKENPITIAPEELIILLGQISDRYIYEYLDWSKDFNITPVYPDFEVLLQQPYVRYIFEYLDWKKDYSITTVPQEFPLQVEERFIFEYLDWNRFYSMSIPPELLYITQQTDCAPGPFFKLNPINGAVNQPLSLTLDWEDSDVRNYEYCVSTTPTCTTWVPTGTISQAVITGLVEETTYYWEVRTSNAFATTYADDADWWSFRTIESFGKSRPTDGAVNQKTRLNIEWEEYIGSVSYEYCVDKVLDGKCTSPSEWVNVGLATSATVSRLKMETTYEWQVNAVDINGVRTPADKGDWWIFITKSKPSPKDLIFIE